MTDPRAQKRRLAKRLLTEWVRILQLQDYTIRMRLRARLDPMAQACEWTDGNDHTSKTAIITISLAQSSAELEHSIAHELSHIVTSRTCDAYWTLSAALTRSMPAQVYTDARYNDLENDVIEHFLRVLFHACGKEYPPHHAATDEIVVKTRWSDP